MLIAIVFVASIAFVYVMSASILLRLVKHRNISRPDQAILALAGAGLLCIAYGRFVEPNWLATTHIEIRSSKLAAGQHPIRIVLFSDLHSEPRPRLEPELVQAVAAERPDVIVFTGDSINAVAGVAVLRDCIAAMAKIAPTFVVRGNWDITEWYAVDLFSQTGAKELNGEAVRLEIGGTPVWIAGLAYDNLRGLRSAVRGIPSGEFSVLLYHSPDLMPEVAESEIDLYCAGHTHGGQVALPFYGAMITASDFGKRYEAGLYHEKKTWLYVNRGIGMAAGIAPRVRFLSRPELTVIDIRPSG